MRLYLVRHGESGPSPFDFERTLTPEGRRAVARLGDRAAQAGVHVEQIRHSGLVRARETAEILASRLSPPGGVAEMTGTAPDDDEEAAAIELSFADAPILLVTHMPFVARLAGRLVAGRSAVALPFGTAELRGFEGPGPEARERDGGCWVQVLALDSTRDG